ncbi:hypothetical protein MMC34_000542 [Xylographa carneopallida]|nr:hypothetical protein [Xylographa carneopallida]
MSSRSSNIDSRRRHTQILEDPQRSQPLRSSIPPLYFHKDPSEEKSPLPPPSVAFKVRPMFIEDAFLWYFLRSYNSLQDLQLISPWNFYLYGEGIAGLMRIGDKLLWERYRHLFLEAYETQAYRETKRLPESASKSEKKINRAAVESLGRACEAAYIGKSYRWTDPTLVKKDWAKSPGMDSLKYHRGTAIPKLPPIKGYAERLQVDRT